MNYLHLQGERSIKVASGPVRIHFVAALLRLSRSRPSVKGGAPLTADVTATTALHREAVSKPLRNESLSNVGYSTLDSSVDIQRTRLCILPPTNHVITLRNQKLLAILLITCNT